MSLSQHEAITRPTASQKKKPELSSMYIKFVSFLKSPYISLFSFVAAPFITTIFLCVLVKEFSYLQTSLKPQRMKGIK